MNRIFLVAMVLSAVLHAGAAPKLILHGWDTLDVTPEELLAHADLIAETGADGVSFAIRTQNAAQERIHSCYLMEGADWQWQDVSRYAETIRQTVKLPGLGASMLHFRCQPTVRLALTNDAAWARAAANLATLARLAKEGGLKGLTLDPEDRQGSCQYAWDPDSDPPWDEAVALMRRRGAEFFGGAFEAFPDMDLLAFSLLSRDSSYGDDPADPELATRSRNDLWPAFVNGLLDVLPPSARLSDGDAQAFGYESAHDDFAHAASRQLTGLLPLVAPENRAKYRAQNMIGFGLCLDRYVMPAGSPSGQPAVRGSRVAAFDANLRAALKASDGYVWLCGEHHPFIAWRQPLTSQTMARWRGSATWEGPLPGIGDVLWRRTKPLDYVTRRQAEMRGDGTYANLLPGSVADGLGNVNQFVSARTTDAWYALSYDMTGVGPVQLSWMCAQGWRWECSDYPTYSEPDADGVRHGVVVSAAPTDSSEIYVCMVGNSETSREVAYSGVELLRVAQIGAGSASENVGRIAEANLSVPLDTLPSGDGVGLERGVTQKRRNGPENLSDVTFAGGNRFYAVSDAGETCGLYELTVEFSADGKSVSSYSVGSRVALAGAHDIRGVAYDPGSGCVWVADAGNPAIVEFGPDDGKTRRHVEIPEILKGTAADRGFGALTISGDGLAMWTATEEALPGDGPVSSYRSPTTVRLVKFVRPDTDAEWSLAAMYAYTVEAWHQPHDFGGAGRRGVSGLCALPDGSLLVLEREFSTDAEGNGSSAEAGAKFCATVYRVSEKSMERATDVTLLATLADVSRWTPVSKERLYEQVLSSGESALNYEGLCLGPRLESGNAAVLALTNGGDATAEACLVPFALTGLNIRTLRFEKPACGSSSVAGYPFRYLEGARVTVLISDAPEFRPYAVDGTKLAKCTGWSVTSGAPLPGTDARAAFRVSGDGTFSWTVGEVVADKGYHAADSFEAFAAETPAEALEGWSGPDCEVVEDAYAPPTPPGHVMPKETHTRVLNAEEGTAVREMPDSSTATEKIDVMVRLTRSPGELAAPSDVTQVAVASDGQGRLCLWHLFLEDGEWRKGWIPLSETAYADGTWVRLGLELDYEGNPDGLAFVRARIDGSYCPTEHGVRAPNDLRPYGAWHCLARNLQTGGVSMPSKLSVSSSRVDDLVICKKSVEAEHTGPVAVDGIGFGWFDQAGLPRDPNASAPFIPGYTLGDAHDAGIDPYSDQPLKVTDFVLGEGGQIHVEINGYRGDNPMSYGLIHSGTPDFKTATAVEASEGTFRGDAVSRTTVWDGTPSTGEGFYRIKATR